jgi:predicted PurR-regulated permease PerM
MTTATHRDVTRITLSVLGIGLLIVGSFWVLRPFLAALLWAVMIAVSTWPLMLRLQRRLGGRRGGAIAVMTLALLLLLFVPLYLAVATILGQSDRIVEFVRALPGARVPPPPSWVGAVPLVGPAAAERWLELASLAPQELTARLAPHVRTALAWFAAQAGGFGSLVFHFLLTVVITAIVYAKGEGGADLLLRFFRRLAGERGDAIVILAGKAIRAVALGIIVTAVVQTVVAALGLLVAGVPFAGIISAVVFILCIAQLGPILALVPCVIWLYATGAPGRGTLLLVITVAAQAFDNVLRPFLIKRGGADLSLLIIFPGVVGGLLWLGIGGLFVGPVILAVTWTLLQGWIAYGLGESAPAAVPATGQPIAGAGETPNGGKTSVSAR